ncbi:MAG: D-alanyl-D-alanine carboxypeptidase [Oscillibacter sp.]|nr:D-alanyl-D-alanine carboxypeptidase [Oscillibacter sp.]
MEDFQVILEELDKMEEAARKRERARRWRAIQRRRKERQRKQIALLLLMFCLVLALPLSSAISVHIRGTHTPDAAPLTLSVETPDDGACLVGDQSFVDGAEGPETVLYPGADYGAEEPETVLYAGRDYGGDNPEAAFFTGADYGAENPELPFYTGENYKSETRTASLMEALSAEERLARENPENLLPGESPAPLPENPENALPTQDYVKTPSTPAPSSPSSTSSAKNFTPTRWARTITLGESAEIGSQYAVLLDADTGYIRAERNSDVKVSPASMTKVLTLLVATEKLIKVTPEGVKGMDTKVTVTREVRDYCYRNNCSTAGFATWETVTVRDLLYGCILPSGADACLALARHISGSHEAFVELMNQKLQQLGISKTAHFTNCIGLYNKDHYCTMRDMAVIMKAAMDHSICRVILGARTFRTSATAEHPKGIALSNLFLRRIEDRFTGTNLYISGAKTGYVNQSGNCAVSYATRDDGKHYICVTGKAAGAWRAIYDHTLLYRAYCLN